MKALIVDGDIAVSRGYAARDSVAGYRLRCFHETSQ
jgi:hypothetical protein